MFLWIVLEDDEWISRSWKARLWSDGLDRERVVSPYAFVQSPAPATELEPARKVSRDKITCAPHVHFHMKTPS